MMEKPTSKPIIPESYSEAFRKDVERIGLEKLLKNSDFDGTLEEWEAQRRFLTSAFDRDGSVLDYGCANGFFLRSLQEWTRKNLDPYGVDSNPERIEMARDLFRSTPEHFAEVGQAKKAMDEDRFPGAFDYIYWNVWDNADFLQEEGQIVLRRGMELTKPGGRFVLGFYDAGGRPRIDEKVSQLLTLGFRPAGQLWSESGKQSGVIFEK